MAAKEKDYIRLPGAGSRWAWSSLTGGWSRLWLGKDHLLMVNSTGYAEEYKRFFFRDIQFITLRQTGPGVGWIATFATFAVLFLALALAVGDVGTIVFGSVAGVFALMLAVHLARGPMAVCQLRTAVQTEHLPSLCRVRRALAVLDRIRPLIVAAQGELKSTEAQPAPPVVLAESEPVAEQT
jgi:hypothetical protein